MSQKVFDRKAMAFEYMPNSLDDINFYKTINYDMHLVQFAFY